MIKLYNNKRQQQQFSSSTQWISIWKSSDVVVGNFPKCIAIIDSACVCACMCVRVTTKDAAATTTTTTIIYGTT